MELNLVTKSKAIRSIRFDISRWRMLLNRVANKALPGKNIKVISPFGFEVFQNEQFLDKPLRRFYCYIACEDEILSSENTKIIELEFSQSLRKTLECDWPEMANDIVAYKTHKGLINNFTKEKPYSKTSKALSVKYIESANIIESYAKNIVCAIQGICDNNLPEAKNFNVNQVSRNRICQLYLMNEEIFKYFMPALTTDEIQMKNQLYRQDNRLEYFLNPKLSPLATEEELHIFSQLIQRRLRLMLEILQTGSTAEQFELSVPVFHGTGILSMKISKAIWQPALDFIQSTYNNFGCQ